MSTSYKFKDIGQYIYTLATELYTNQNILRYLAYLTDDPLATKTVNRQGKVVNQPDITADFDDCGILLTEYDASIVNTDQCFLFIHVPRGKFPFMKTQGELTFLVDIIVPKNFNRFKGSSYFRDFCIADEISSVMDNSPNYGIRNACITEFASGKLDADYHYLTMCVSIKEFNIRG